MADTPRVQSITELIWPRINETNKNIVLYPINSEGTKDWDHPSIIKPGDRIILPKQVQFIKALRKYDATLYGGAVGSGKSHILRWALVYLLITWAKMGMRNVDVGLFCETYPILRDRQISKIRQFPEWLGTWKEEPKEFQLANQYGGGTIKCRNLDDTAKYASAEFAAIAIDELTYNPKQTFDFLRTRRRWPGIDMCPMFGATNPGNVGHAWVFKEFVNPKTRTGPFYDEELDYMSSGNCFIQAFPEDNPFLSKQYLADLNRLPEKQKRALVKGDWTVYEGQFFSQLDPNVQLVPQFIIPDHWAKYRAIDQGLIHPTVCLWIAVDPEPPYRAYVYREYSCADRTMDYHKRRIVEMSGEETYRMTVGDPAMWTRNGSVSGNKSTVEVLNDRNDGLGSLGVVQAANARQQGWEALQVGFSWEGEYVPDETGRPRIKMTRAPNLYVMQNCPHTWSSLTNLLHDKVKQDDAHKTKGAYGPGFGDDEAETLRYGYYMIAPGARSSRIISLDREAPVFQSPFVQPSKPVYAVF